MLKFLDAFRAEYPSPFDRVVCCVKRIYKAAIGALGNVFGP
jgi:hypothetical protein